MILGSLPPSRRHTTLVAAFALGFGDALAMALQHGLALTHGAEDSQHQAAGARGGVERLVPGDRQNAQADPLDFEVGNDRQEVAN